ncbi:hypothetical protein AB4Z25_25015 [Rhizobium sp. RAF36]|uniref:hypothetical protein n=1 Tax=Rhizobium sp. RAF36 TaxID=3233055 RepID=UPI003F965064
MKWFLSVVTAAMLLLPAGCSTEFGRLDAIPQSDIYKVVAEVKRQISIYTAYQASDYGYKRIVAASRSKVCGNGMIGFDISSVKMELVSTSVGSQSVGVSLSPIPSGGIRTVGGSVGASREVTDTQSFVISEDVVPSPYSYKFDLKMLDTAPLARSMINLWAAALQSGDDASDICLRIQKSESDGNTFQIGITVAKDVNGEVNVGLSSLGLTAGGELKATTGNTITVRFKAHDFSKPIPPRPAPCKPKDPRPECQLQHNVAPS